MAYTNFCAMNHDFEMSYGHHFSYANSTSDILSVGVIKVTSAFYVLSVIISGLVVRIRKKLYNMQARSYDSA